MDVEFNQKANVPAGYKLDALYPVLDNDNGVTGYWFSLDNALANAGTGLLDIESYCNRLTANPSNNVCLIETDTPEDYGLFLDVDDIVV